MKNQSVSLVAFLFLGITAVPSAHASEPAVDEEIVVIAETVDESAEGFDESDLEMQTSLRGNLSCSTKVFNTAATATCTGSGTWRLRIDCKNERDYVGGWNYQSGGTLKKGGECTFKARGASVESK